MSEAKNREIRISIPEDIFSFFFPEKTVDHVLKARKEMLLALRSLIDAKIEALEKKGEKTKAKRKKIKID
jgi:hypothetical protein